MITTIAGNRSRNYTGDGAATKTGLSFPFTLAVDSAGTVYVGDEYGLVRKLSSGTITTFEGNGPVGYLGDGGPAIQAAPVAFCGPALENNIIGQSQSLTIHPTVSCIATDASGSVYLVGGRVRKVANGIITTVAGDGGPSNSPSNGEGGPAIAAHLFIPTGVAADSKGNLYGCAQEFGEVGNWRRLQRFDFLGAPALASVAEPTFWPVGKTVELPSLLRPSPEI